VRALPAFVLLAVGCSEASIGEPGGVADGGVAGDARPVSADAASVDAAPCVAGEHQLLRDPGFEEGMGAWQSTGGNLVVPDSAIPISPASGAFAARMLQLNSADQSLVQEIAVPAGTSSLVFAGMRCWVTGEEPTGKRDRLAIELVDGQGRVVDVLGAYSNEDAVKVCNWGRFEAAATGGHPGEVLSLRLRAISNATIHTTFYLDDLELVASTTCE
jgi:hypothetical protein